MAFQIKDFISIVASKVNAARGATTKITDFQPGSVARTLLEAPAVEIEELYHQFWIGLREAIPVATFLSFGFTRLPASRARGYVSVAAEYPRTEDLVVPTGTEFRTESGATYRSTADTTWRANESMVIIYVESDVVGITGNAGAGAIVSSPFFASSPVSISNQEITTGKDEESPAEREARFAEYIESLSRGTVPACLYAAGLASVVDENGVVTEYVTRRGVIEQRGYVRVFLYSSRGVPSAALLADAQRKLDGSRDEVTNTFSPGYRAAGVQVEAVAMMERQVPLSVRVEMMPGAVLTQQIIQRMRDIFASAIVAVQPGGTLFLGEMTEMLLSVDGVKSIIPVTSENFYCAENEALLPGVFTAAPLA